ncbi:hypothetical protein KBI23_05285 [bacterium]|nr:hypothetical protein [bacterium]MBP9807922.1 hypothetical protein [bacterium]
MADVAESILSKKADAAAADPVKTDFGTIFEPPKLSPKPSADNPTAKAPTDAAVLPSEKVIGSEKVVPVEQAAPVEPVTTPKEVPAATDKSAPALDLAKPLIPELVNGLALSKEVARILDNDVPVANRAQNIPEAEAAYNRAIEIAKQVTPEQIAAAKADYEAVLKAKASEKDPEKLRALAERQAADYTLMRVSDCAQGNKALWLYRQGRIEEGSAQFLQAAGLSPEDAKNLSKLTPEQKSMLGEKLNANATILTDPNFMRQYMRIMESGQKLPQEFVDIHQYLRDEQENAAAVKVSDTPVDPSQETRIATIQRLFPNEAANLAAVQEGKKLFDTLNGEGATALTAEQRIVLAASVKAADDNLLLNKARYEFTTAELERLVPVEKAQAVSAAMSTLDAEFIKLEESSPKGVDGKSAISQADKELWQTITSAEVSSVERDAAIAKMGQAHPALGAALSELVGNFDSTEDCFSAMRLQVSIPETLQKFDEAVFIQAASHLNYALLLNNIPGKAEDGSDNKDTAKAVLESSFANLPDETIQRLVANPLVVQLATETGAKLPEVTKSAESAESAAEPASTTDAPASTPIAPDDAAAQLAAATPEQLLDAARVWSQKGPDYIPQTMAAYEELIKRLEDPATIEAAKKQLESNVVALEKEQTLDGKPMDAATRLQYHQDNAEVLNLLSQGITFRREYAAYLGGKDALAIDTKKPENLQPMLGSKDEQMNLNKSMNDQLKLVYQAADNMPVDLMKRELANLEKSMNTIGSSDTDGLIAKAIDILQGNKDVPGAIDISVTTRTAAAMMYISQGAVFNKETNVWERRSSGAVDSLYQPTMALELLKQADAKYKEIHGANATDPGLDRVKAFGAQLAPEQFKVISTKANTEMWSNGANLFDFGLSFATQLGMAALLSKTRMGFAAKHAVADVTSIGVNYASRAAMMRYGTGEWEDPADTAVNAAAAAAFVAAFKYGGIAGKNFRQGNIASYQSVADAARNMDNQVGKVMTLGEYGDRLAGIGMNTEAQAIRSSSFAGRKIAELTDDQLKAILPTSLSRRGAEAMSRIQAGMTPELKAIIELQKKGISTVGDMKAAVAKDLSSTQEFVQAAKALPGYEKMTPRQIMEKLAASGNSRFDTAEKITNELAGLAYGARLPRLGNVESFILLGDRGRKIATRQINSIADVEAYLVKATPEGEVARLFPGLKGQADDAILRQVEGQGKGIFGNLSRNRTDGQGWRKLDGMSDQIEKIQPKTMAAKASEIAWTNRFYSGLSIPKTTNASVADVQALAAGMKRRADGVSVASYIVGYHAYESITGVYDRLGKGVDENGKPRSFAFGEAMLDANFGSTNPTAMDFLGTAGRDFAGAFFAGPSFRALSRVGMAETRDLGFNGVRETVKTLGNQSLGAPPFVPFWGATISTYQQWKINNGADQPLADKDYGLGLTVGPDAMTPESVAPQPTYETPKQVHEAPATTHAGSVASPAASP